MDSMKFEVEARSAETGDEEWVGKVFVKSSGGIERVIYTTTGSHPSTTKAENAAVMEFSSQLSLTLSDE